MFKYSFQISVANLRHAAFGSRAVCCVAFKAMLAARAVDPWAIVPKTFDFKSYTPQKSQRTSAGSTAAKSEEKAVQNLLAERVKEALPGRIYLSAYSCNFGSRLSGMRCGPALVEFTEIFRHNFLRASLPRLVLPCNGNGTLPFVAPDGLLPNPAGLCVSAIRILGEEFSQMETSKLTPAQLDLLQCYNEGLEVEWYPTDSFMGWVILQEASMQQSERRTQACFLEFTGSAVSQ